MRKGNEVLYIIFSLFIIIPSLQLQAQNFDCDLALIICSDSTINFQPNGGGINDFANPNNDSGCFVPEPSPGLPPENYFEQASGWFYFEFRKDMPDSSIIEFAISPILLGPDDVSDFDFAIYGPNVRCDSLGSPKRCSFVNGNCAFCPDTGLGRGEIDESEDTWVPGNNANGFVAPMIVQPGDGFFLFLEYFEGDSPVDQTQFDLSWDGSAAPFLNCIANPFCYKATANAGRDTSVCAGSTIQLFGSATNTFGQESYIWSGDNGATSWIEDRFSTNPTINIPIDFSGQVAFELLVEEGNCEKYDTVVIDVIPYPPLNISGDNFICEGEQVTLTANTGFESYTWSTGENTTSITVLEGGTYDLTVTNSMACERVASFTVFMEKFPDPIIMGDPGFCKGQSVTLMTDDEYADYQWSTGDTTSSIQVDQVGSYSVQVTTRLGGCVGAETVNVIEYPESFTEISGDTDLCPDELSTLSVVDTFTSYLWSTGATSPNIDVGQAGAYFVEATDRYGCKARDTIETTGLSAPQPVLPATASFCPGDSVALQPGNGFETYTWSTGASTPDIVANTPGDYTVSVTDAFGCVGTATAVLDTFTRPQAGLQDQYGICAGDDLQLQANTGFAAYEWSTGENAPIISVDTEGEYSLTLTDNNGCVNTASAQVEVYDLPLPLIAGDTTICGGEQAHLVVQDGFESYEWSSGETSPDISTSIQGIYGVTVTDARGCMGTTQVDVDVQDLPEPVITGVDIFCPGDTALLATELPYVAYQWSTGAEEATAEVTDPGIVSVRVTDNNGCRGDTTFSVAHFEQPQPQIMGPPELCSGDSVSLELEQAYSSYEWSVGENTENLMVKSGGVYSVTVTDGQGCRGTDEITIIENVLPEPIIEGPAAICSYESATLNVTNAFESYEWQDGSSLPSFQTNQPGAYRVSVTDEKGCTGVEEFELQVNQAPEPVILGDRTFCQGDTLRLEADQDYAQYNWSTSGQSKSTSVLVPGEYGLTVTGAEGCIGDTMVNIIQFSKPKPFIEGKNEFCSGESVELALDRPYSTYAWNNGETTSAIQVSIGGNYTVTITDAVGCEAETSFEVTENLLPEPQIQGPDQICSYEMATLQAQAGFETYQWQNGTTNPAIDVNQSGTYAVSVTDDKGCMGVDSFAFQVNQAPEPDIRGSALFCRGDTAFLDAGNTNYVNYEWSNGATTAVLPITDGGSYEVTVTDDKGCRGSGTFESRIKELPVPSIEGTPEFCENGSTELRSGENYVSYAWSTGDNTPAVNISAAGNYQLTVIDEDGCRGTQSIEVAENKNPTPEIMGDRIFCSNEFTDLGVRSEYAVYRWSTGEQSVNIIVDEPGTYEITVIDDNGCSGATSAAVTTLQAPEPEIEGDNIFCEGDTLSFGVSAPFESYQWSNGANTPGISVAIPDNYTVTVTDSQGCRGEASFQPIQFSKPRPVIQGPKVFCEGAGADLSTERSYMSYRWSTGSTDRQLTVDRPGAYSVTVVDNQGCVGSSEELVTELPNPIPQISGDTLLCTGENTQLDAGDGYFTYLWEGGQREQRIQVSENGRYQVTVIDSNGCSGEDAVQVKVFERPDPVISGGEKFCTGDTIQIQVGDFQSYAWSTGQQSREIDITRPGNYEVTVTNEADCAAQASILLDAFPRPLLEIEGDRFFCENTFTSLSPTSGYPQYEWSNGSTSEQIMIDEPGVYELEVTDENGCRNQAVAEVEEIPTPAPFIDGPPALCDNESATLRAATNFAQYNWSTGAQTSSIQIESAGLFDLTVTDGFGCVGQDSIEIQALEAPDPFLEGLENFCPGDSVLLSIDDNYQSYNWSDGYTGPTRFVDEDDLYVVQVVAANGCQATLSKRVRARSNPVFDIAGDTTYCEGENTLLSIPDNFSRYRWSTGDTTAGLIVNTPGAYQVEVTNEFGCVTSRQVEVEELEILDPILPQEATVCTGDSLVLNAGNNYREYLWDDGSTDAIRLVTDSGAYAVTLTNFNGCVQELKTEVAEVTPVFPEIVGANAVCQGQGLSLLARGNFLDYRWSTGDTTPFVTVRTDDNYRVTVTDQNGCKTTDEKRVDLLPAPEVQIKGLPFYCEGGSTMLEAEVDGGDFVWDNGATSPTITVSQPGNYGVFVRSDNGCTVVRQVTVEEFKNPTPEIVGLQEICSDEEAVLESDQEYVRYQWSTGSEEPSIVVSESGRYELMVTDTTGCRGRAVFDLQVNRIPEPLIVGKEDICPGDTVVLGLDQDYAGYEWSNGLVDSSIQVTEAGIFFVEVIDAEGCSGIADFNLKAGEVPQIELQGDSVMCEGSQVQVGVKGDFATYRWSDGRGGKSVEIFEPGEYDVSVTNASGCEQSKSFNIRQVERPMANAGEDLEADCTEPAIALDGSGSSEGDQYVYLWTGPDIDKDNQNMINPMVNISGRYRLTVRDTIHGCLSAADEVTVTFRNEAPNAMTYTKGVITCENDKVLLGAEALTNDADLSFRWFDPDDNEIARDSLGNFYTNFSGPHSVLITDELSGCTATKVVEVEENTLLPRVDAGPDVYLDCSEPTTALDGTKSDQGDSYSFRWTSREGAEITDAASLKPRVSEPGWYYLEIRRLANGCMSMDSVLVRTDTLIPVAEAGLDQRLSCNDQFVQLDGTASQGAGQLTYRWTSPDHPNFIAISPQPAISKPGRYRLMVQDIQNGCVDMDSVMVEEGGQGPQDLHFTVIPPSCRGDQNGRIVLDSVSGGEGPFLFSFELGAYSFQEEWNNLGAGEYRIIVQDPEGCDYLERVEVPDGGVLSVELGADQEIRKGASAYIDPFVPDLPVSELDSILWSPLDSLHCEDGNCLNVRVNPTFDVTYRLKIVDSKGCAAEDQVRITVVDSADVYIPNGFSPDNDGNNDRFTVYGSDFIKEVKLLQVFDRWGNRMFLREHFPPNDESLGWDGYYRGRPMKPAVFVFYAEVEMKDGEVEEFKGSVTLVK